MLVRVQVPLSAPKLKSPLDAGFLLSLVDSWIYAAYNAAC